MWLRTRTVGVAIGALALITISGAAAAVPPGWSDPVPLAAGAGAELLIGSDDRMLLTWTDDHAVWAMSSTNDGATWAPAVEVFASQAERGLSHAAIGSDGTMLIVSMVYDLQDYLTVQTATSRDGGVHWTSPVPLPLTDDMASVSQVGVADDGSMTVMWSNGASTRRVETSSSVDGVSWSAPVAISPDSWGTGGARFGIHGNGTRTAAWAQFDGKQWVVRASTSADGGYSWREAVDILATGTAMGNPHISIGADGIVSVISLAFGSPFYMVDAAESTDWGSTWGASRQLTSGLTGPEPAFSFADAETYVVTFHSVGINESLVYAASTNRGATWTEPVVLAELGDNPGVPQTAASGDTMVILWSSSGDGVAIAWTVMSADGGATWGERRPLSASGNNLHSPSLASGSDGTIGVVWSEFAVGATRPGPLLFSLLDGDGEKSIAAVPVTPSDPAGSNESGVELDWVSIVLGAITIGGMVVLVFTYWRRTPNP